MLLPPPPPLFFAFLYYDDVPVASTNNQEVKNIICSFLPDDCPLINALIYCANCNKKAEPFTLKMCTACRSVSYCNVDCQKAHRKHHKHQCKQDAQYITTTTNPDYVAKYCVDIDDDNGELLFQPIPPNDDCPICFLPLPVEYRNRGYMPCCSKLICQACRLENVVVTIKREQIPSCPFCREPAPTSYNELVVRIKKRMEINDSVAILNASQLYKFGMYGLPKDPQKEFDLCIRAAELGNLDACNSAARFYHDGVVVTKDMPKAKEYYEKAAKKGNIYARYNLGHFEQENENFRLASRHWLISAAAGNIDSLERIPKLYKMKLVTKKEYATVLASYSNVHKDEWSIEREAEEAAAAADAEETRQHHSPSNYFVFL